MPRHLVQIAGLAVELCWDRRQARFALPVAYGSFLSSASQVDCVVQIEYAADPPGSESLQERGWDFFAGEVWAVSIWENGWFFVSPSPRVARWQRLLRWRPRQKCARLWIHPDQPADDPLQNLTLPFFAALFARHRGVLVHAAAVEVDGRAWVFAGPSGTGKSYWAQQWLRHGWTILDEDRIVLREMEGQVWAYGTPWHIEPRLCSPRGAPVERLFFLRETAVDTVQETEPASAAALLLRSCFLPVYDADSMRQVLAVAGQCALQSRTFRLGYARGETLVGRLLEG